MRRSSSRTFAGPNHVCLCVQVLYSTTVARTIILYISLLLCPEESNVVQQKTVQRRQAQPKQKRGYERAQTSLLIREINKEALAL